MTVSIRILLSALLIFTTFTFSQNNTTCLECHDDPEFVIHRGKKTISLNISPTLYKASPHSELLCVDCHVDFDPDEEPHRDVIPPVDCTPCHEEASSPIQHSRHQPDVSCFSCHGDVHLPQKTETLKSNCQNCHEEVVSELAESVHREGTNTPTCFQCHIPGSSSFVNNTDACLNCHGKKEFIHSSPTHRDFQFVLSYRESIHGENIDCADCHSGHRILPADSTSSKKKKKNIAQTCSQCHEQEASQFLISEHGKAYLEGFSEAPSCVDCHGEHEIHQITDSRSPVSREHEVEVCLSCHLNSPEVRQRMTHTSAFVAEYEQSVHGRAFVSGNKEAAVCSDCHGGHRELKATNANSMVNKFNVAITCGKCHDNIEAEFIRSIHGSALFKGVADAPSCTDCHGEHHIIEHTRPESPVAPQNVA
ncbi:MAG: hypothetical protein D6732_04710, partial [Methanobacteriota archaeon]